MKFIQFQKGTRENACLVKSIRVGSKQNRLTTWKKRLLVLCDTFTKKKSYQVLWILDCNMFTERKAPVCKIFKWITANLASFHYLLKYLLFQVDLSSSLLIPHYIEQYICVPFLLSIQNNKSMNDIFSNIFMRASILTQNKSVYIKKYSVWKIPRAYDKKWICALLHLLIALFFLYIKSLNTVSKKSKFFSLMLYANVLNFHVYKTFSSG